MFEILQANNFDALYIKIIHLLYKDGIAIETRNLKTIELLFTKLILTNPRNRLLNNNIYKTNLFYFIGELCFYLSGSKKLNFINKYSKFWNTVSDDNETVNSCYGYRIFKQKNKVGNIQIEYAISQLIKDKNTRKAVIMLASPEDAFISKDNICTINIQLLIRNNKLYMINNMRSNDVVYGLIYDVAFFSFLQEYIYVILKNYYPKLELGYYIHNVASLHIYEKHFKLFNKLNNKEFFSRIKMPELKFSDTGKLNDLLIYEEQLRRNESKKQITFWQNNLLKNNSDFLNWCQHILETNKHKFIKEVKE